MVETDQGRRQHLVLDGVTTPSAFKGRAGGKKKVVPARNRADQAGALARQLAGLDHDLELARQEQVAAGMAGGYGLQIEFESFPDVVLAFEQLASQSAGIELLNVRHRGSMTLATVFVPAGKLVHFEKIIADYLAGKTDKNGHARDHQKLVDAIGAIRRATVKSLWTDDDSVFPVNAQEVIWWEVWLPAAGHRLALVDSFRTLAANLEIPVHNGAIQFPERTVLLVRASTEQLSRSLLTLNSIAELRRAKQTAEFPASLLPEEQPEWTYDLLRRTTFAARDMRTPHICIFDTGVNNGHVLLAPALADADRHTLDPNYGSHDAHGHGTATAGLALFGDLKPLLASSRRVYVGHRLESVKMMEQDGANAGDAAHHGYLTVEAVARPEITAPARRRVFSMAITARDNRDRGRPSAWSAALDRLAADVDGGGATPRLLAVSAGNILDMNAWANSPASNTTDAIHDPGQAWNVLTVGAYTDLVEILEDAPGCQPVAPAGGLSPFSTTSATWGKDTPLKPDVLFEGGNAAKDRHGAAWSPSLSVVTTHHMPPEKLLTTANATSAATALAARMAAQLMAEYPALWPEGIRGLMVHSAVWTPAMLQAFLPSDRLPTKADYVNLVRHCGFGVPDMERAQWTVRNSLTLIVQEALQPFQRISGEPKMREMHLHQLPWPQQALEDLGEIQVELRVTLSYFIEPNPSARGMVGKYGYHSHGLRFDMRRPGESTEGFQRRINLAAQDDEEGLMSVSASDDVGWLVGERGRTKGSLHTDIWRGDAAALARRGVLAVYPTGGWWKNRKQLQRYDNQARYVLLVSIHAPDIDVDLLTEVTTPIDTEIPSGV